MFDLKYQESVMKYFTSSLAALAFVTTAAQAQDASQAPADQSAAQPAPADAAAPPATPAPEAAAPAAGAGTQVSDTEVDSFAKATVAVQKISADAQLDESAKQKQMAEAVKSAGLEPARYNDIGKAVSSDPALLAKIRTAMAKYAGPSKG
jgi:2-oxoglutarate dehydrogenase E2 component (dihydrolipoamide succinyltransferase)